ncbi:MAG TPA: hypothetical protein P5298_07295 [Spirochaetia bacterium]|nr:hypothetical protein [Spirochaetia bacterium]
MNIPFLKLRVADCAWIVFDRSTTTAAPPSADGDRPWPAVARAVCDRHRGAAAVGVAAIEVDGDRLGVRTWDSGGEERSPTPAALLCASRLLFDAGRADAETIELRTGDGTAEILVLDSRSFGLSVGLPATDDGSPLDRRYGSGGLGLAAAPGAGVAMSLRVGGERADVALYDGPRGARGDARRGAARRARGEVARVDAIAVARHELRIRRGSADPILAAAASTAAAVVADYADRETVVVVGGDRLVVQWPEGGPVFVAAAPEYCLSGEFWLPEEA